MPTARGLQRGGGGARLPPGGCLCGALPQGIEGSAQGIQPVHGVRIFLPPDDQHHGGHSGGYPAVAATGSPMATYGISIGTLTGFVLLFQRFFQPIVALGMSGRRCSVPWQGRSASSRCWPSSRSHRWSREPREDRRGAGTGAATASLPASPPPAPLVELSGAVFGYLEGSRCCTASRWGTAGAAPGAGGTHGLGKEQHHPPDGWPVRSLAGLGAGAGLDPYALIDSQRRHLIGAVPQTVQLFQGTVRDKPVPRRPGVPEAAIAGRRRSRSGQLHRGATPGLRHGAQQ